MTAPAHRSKGSLLYERFDGAEEGLREALTSTGNGYFCTRGSAEWEDPDGVHYPGTYTHGGYNRETTIMGGTPVLNEDLVNLPNWTVLKLRIGGGEVVRLDDVELLSYRHEYDIAGAVLARALRFRDQSGGETTLSSRRFVSMADRHLAGIEWTITAENWSGRVEIVSALDGRVANAGVARYRELEGRHLEPVLPRTFGPDVIALMARTRQSRIYVAEAARTKVYSDGVAPEVEQDLYQMEDYIQQVLSFDVREGAPVRVEKMVGFYTSRDYATSEPLGSAGNAVRTCPSFSDALADHRQVWNELWEMCGLVVASDPAVQLRLRLHASHVLQVCSGNTAEVDSGVVARGLNGEAYRGHVFWDELFVLLYLSFRMPRVTRHLLLYRARRLGEARRAAQAAGFRGAMYPWQSGSDGKEETQVVHLNPLSGRWEPDLSHNQRHVNAAIFYNIWLYYRVTGDREFMVDHGAEMMLEIARFWGSLVFYNPERDRYEIHGVMGPDEFHESYPGAEGGGLRNNAYTNVMVAWICQIAPKVLDLLPEGRARSLRARIDLTDDEIDTWARVSRRMFVPFHADGIISQFEGYGQLAELDWDAYRERYDGKIQRLDRILRAEDDDPGRYKMSKQADTVMLFYLFSDEELAGLFERLGYEFAPDTARKNIDYYDRRTSHGSTLSFVTYAGALAEVDPDRAWERFLVALESDIGDIQGGTTKEGIHMGVMAGTLDLVQRAFLGTSIRDDVLSFAPRLVEPLDGLSFSMQFRGVPLRVSLSGAELTVAALPEAVGGPVRVAMGADVRELRPGQRCAFKVGGASSGDHSRQEERDVRGI
ncbi:MAG TPA: glycosyl hydrolase family 65 protein [Acidimicrobiales bacterium]|jgi:trehalose/maltose hydrolase-like predicted phosphorylase